MNQEAIRDITNKISHSHAERGNESEGVHLVMLKRSYSASKLSWLRLDPETSPAKRDGARGAHSGCRNGEHLIFGRAISIFTEAHLGEMNRL